MGFDHAAHTISAVLMFAVLINQVHIDRGDAIADSVQSIFYNATDLISQGLVTFDVVVSMNLDLHGGFFRSLSDYLTLVSRLSFSSSSLAAGSEDAGFCPVINRPSLTTWGCQSAPLE